MRWPARWRRPFRVLADLAILLALGYLGAIVYLYTYQVEIVFRAPRQGALYARSLGLNQTRVVVTSDRGLATEAWRIRATGAVSPYWVLYLHGNDASITTSANLRRYD